MPATSHQAISHRMPAISTRAEQSRVTGLTSQTNSSQSDGPAQGHLPKHTQRQFAQKSTQNEQAAQNIKAARTGVLPKPQSVQNRVSVLLVHIPRLSIRGQARLAAEVGVSRSTISRLVASRINPSYRLARGVTTALEKMLGRPLDMREVFSTDGTYLTASGCALCHCKGCLPERAYDREGNLRPEWRGQRPGDWSLTPAINNNSANNCINNSTDSHLQDTTIGNAAAGKENKVEKEDK